MSEPSLTPEIVLTLAVAAGALALFIWGRVRVDVIGLLVMTSLILLGVLPAERAIQGFANEATVTVALMLALSAGVLRTGALDLLRRWMVQLAGTSEWRLLAVIVATIVPLSAFINNTAAVAILLPMVLSLSREVGTAPSRLLMPLSFAGQLGGTLTLIGTSTNLLVAGLALDLGLDPFEIFTISPPALVLAAVGVVYLFTVGRWLTPVREAPRNLLDSSELRDYLTGLHIRGDSSLVGETLESVRFEEAYGLHVLEIERSGERIRTPDGGTLLREGDLLVVEGKTPDITRIQQEAGVEIAGSTPELTLLDDGEGSRRLAELVVPPRSRAAGRTLRDLNLRAHRGVAGVAIQRHGERLYQPVSDVPLAAGDVLLVAGTVDALQRLHRGQDFALLGSVDLPATRTRKIGVAVVILLAVILLAAFDVAPILVSALAGVAAMFLTGVLTPEEAYEEMDWMVVILLGSILSLGIAMRDTGAAELLANGFLGLTREWGPFGVLAALYLLTSLLTELISNNAAAVVLTPIAVATAEGMGVSPLPLVIGVMFAASNSFMTPVGYQTNTFIYGPGGYRFTDFVRVGGPLNLLLVAVATFAIPLFFPF